MREKAHRCYSGMVMSGAKQAHNIRAQTKSPVYFGDTEQCVRAALAGYWEGEA